MRRKTPASIFLDVLSCPPSLLFHSREENWTRAEEAGHLRLPRSLLSGPPLPHCPPFSPFMSPFPCYTSSRVRSGGETWLVGVAGRQRPGPSLSAAPGAGRRRGSETPSRPKQAGLRPAPSAPARSLRPVRRAPGAGPGPGRPAGAAAKARESPAFLTGSESSSPASRRPEAPRRWGSARPRQAGSTRASSSGSGGRSGHLLGWPPHCGRPRPGGPHGSSLPKFVCPGRKRLSLTKHSAQAEP